MWWKWWKSLRQKRDRWRRNDPFYWLSRRFYCPGVRVDAPDLCPSQSRGNKRGGNEDRDQQMSDMRGRGDGRRGNRRAREAGAGLRIEPTAVSTARKKCSRRNNVLSAGLFIRLFIDVRWHWSAYNQSRASALAVHRIRFHFTVPELATHSAGWEESSRQHWMCVL